ncbi:MAG: OB-fold domain-containing protein [Chloroflexi bacterium]|nr:OB-fold domain-containing protein [Chloroflexota bacterium]MDA1147939.1 OB-fold domain-containing protein [Chloroflexota bacterium]
MTIQDQTAQYLGIDVNIASNDGAHREFLEAAGQGRLALQQCSDCAKLRYPVMTACPFCTSLKATWATVSGLGTIYSYEYVMHPIHPAYRARAPYPVVLVELDEQREFPTADDALRLISSLVDAEGNPAAEADVAIGARVEVEFADLGDGLALPRFRLASEQPAASELWRYGDVRA